MCERVGDMALKNFCEEAAALEIDKPGGQEEEPSDSDAEAVVPPGKKLRKPQKVNYAIAKVTARMHASTHPYTFCQELPYVHKGSTKYKTLTLNLDYVLGEVYICKD